MQTTDKNNIGTTHADSVLTLKRNAIMMNLCDEYRTMWDNANDIEKLMDMAMDVNGAEFLAASSNTAWGLTTAFIKGKVPAFINGNHIHRNRKGYTSEMYAGYEGDITARTALIILIGCKAKVYVPEGHWTQIFVDKDSINASQVECDGHCTVNMYNNKNGEIIHTSGKGKIITNNMQKENGKMAWTH